MTELDLNQTLTLIIAAYAAVVSTFVFGWDAYKWLNAGAKVRITAQTGMKIVGTGRIDPKKYVSLTAVNHGDRGTTITNMGFLFYKSRIKAYLRQSRPDQAFIVTTPSQGQVVPYRLEVGAQWMGMAQQDEDIERMMRDGYIFAVLYCSTIGSGLRQRLTSKKTGNREKTAS